VPLITTVSTRAHRLPVLAAALLATLTLVGCSGFSANPLSVPVTEDDTPSVTEEKSVSAVEGRTASPPPGDSAYLDGLWSRCDFGDFAACDELFLESPVGSRYEAFGDSCGERNEPGGYCEDLYADDPSQVAPRAGHYGSDAYFDELWDECEAGVWVSCDDLFEQSEVGSNYEYFGDTCGLRNDSSDFWCEELYG
jgi:hypothetical protein